MTFHFSVMCAGHVSLFDRSLHEVLLLVTCIQYNLSWAVVAKITSYLNQNDIINITLNIVPQMKEEEAKLVKNLKNFVPVYEYGQLTQVQKTMLQKLIVNQENNLDNNGCIVVPHVCSEGIKIKTVPESAKRASE